MSDLALCPGLLTPAFVTCSTNAGESLVKLTICSDVPGRWVDVWRSGTFFLCSCEVTFWTQECLMSSTQSLHGLCLRLVTHATPPHVHPTSRCPGMSLYVISFTRPFPTSVLQVTNTGGRRPGNEATSDVSTVGRYDTLVVYNGNIQGCKSLKT